MRIAHAQNLPSHRRIAKRRGSELGPVMHLAAPDHIVYGGQSESLVSEVTVEHDNP